MSLIRLAAQRRCPLSLASVLKTERFDGTYNLTVADFETYFVGEQRVLVHNCANKIKHNFTKKHDLGALENAFGGDRIKAYGAVQDAANEALASGRLVYGRNGILPSAGSVVTVRGVPVQLSGGRVINGEVHIGSFSGVIRQ